MCKIIIIEDDIDTVSYTHLWIEDQAVLPLQ